MASCLAAQPTTPRRSSAATLYARSMHQSIAKIPSRHCEVARRRQTFDPYSWSCPYLASPFPADQSCRPRSPPCAFLVEEADFTFPNPLVAGAAPASSSCRPQAAAGHRSRGTDPSRAQRKAPNLNNNSKSPPHQCFPACQFPAQRTFPARLMHRACYRRATRVALGRAHGDAVTGRRFPLLHQSTDARVSAHARGAPTRTSTIP